MVPNDEYIDTENASGKNSRSLLATEKKRGHGCKRLESLLPTLDDTRSVASNLRITFLTFSPSISRSNFYNTYMHTYISVCVLAV